MACCESRVAHPVSINNRSASACKDPATVEVSDKQHKNCKVQPCGDGSDKDGMRRLQVYIALYALRTIDAHLECVEDCCCCIDLPPELLQDVVHLVHHLLPDSASRLDGFEAFQQLKCSVSTPQLPAGVQQHQ